MLVNKDNNSNNMNDDTSTISHASVQTWSPNTMTTSHQEEEEEEDGFLVIHESSSPSSDDALSAPGRMNQTEDEGLDGLDSHQYPPFAPAVPVLDRRNNQDGRGGDGFPVSATTTSTMFTPVLQTVEVDAENGTIRVEMDQDNQNSTNDGPNVPSNKNTAPRSPMMSNLTRYQRCWLIVFARKCARTTGAYSRAAARKYSPKVKRVASRSATAIKDASACSASFVRSKSVQYKNQVIEFNENHQVCDKARSSMKMVGNNVKKASKATVKGVQKASIATAKGIKELEEKHHIVRKSTRGLKKSGRIIRNVWNGKPINTPSHTCSTAQRTAAGESPTSETTGGPSVTWARACEDGSSPKHPPPSSE